MTVPTVSATGMPAIDGSKGAGTAQAARDAMPAAPNQAADRAQTQAFDAQMGVAPSEPGAAGTVRMHQSHETHSLDAVVSKVRAETAALDTRYQDTMKQTLHPSTLVDPSDPMMSMVRLADFSYSASLTLAQYQFSMSMADASNGVSHSLLKNNAE